MNINILNNNQKYLFAEDIFSGYNLYFQLVHNSVMLITPGLYDTMFSYYYTNYLLMYIHFEFFHSPPFGILSILIIIYFYSSRMYFLNSFWHVNNNFCVFNTVQKHCRRSSCLITSENLKS